MSECSTYKQILASLELLIHNPIVSDNKVAQRRQELYRHIDTCDTCRIKQQ